MIRFIYFCMAIVAFSFVAIPVFSGIANKRTEMQNPTTDTTALVQNDEDSLSFEEIYAMSDDSGQPAQILNSIEPAAGMTPMFESDQFSAEPFTNQAPDAL